MKTSPSFKKNPAWSPSDLKRLQELFPTTPNKDLLAHFSNRTEGAIIKRARQLKLLKTYRGPFTPEQRALIIAEYPKLGAGPLAEQMGVPKGSIWSYASDIGLRRDPALLKEVRSRVATASNRARAAKKADQRKAVAKPKPDYRADKRKPCGQERKAGAAKAKPAPAAATPWYRYPRGSAEYLAGERQHFANKQARTITDQCGRPATVYSNLPR